MVKVQITGNIHVHLQIINVWFSMKTANEQLISTLELAIKNGLNKFETQRESDSLSDLYLFFNEENTSLIIYDDMENKLVEIELDKFLGNSNKSHEQEVIGAAKIAIKTLEKNKAFDLDYIYKPFSISFVDADFIVSEELIFIDDEMLKLNNSLLTDLDKELNDFLKELMNS